MEINVGDVMGDPGARSVLFRVFVALCQLLRGVTTVADDEFVFRGPFGHAHHRIPLAGTRSRVR
ncbi:hypothetical protein K2X85_07580 [bacterium]|nr:hypothetical protein [bacterium]